MLVPNSPKDLRLPYEDWRVNQKEVVQEILDTKEKVIFLSAPTGTGKSGIAVSLAKLSGKQAAIVTMTKQLQQQYLSEFRALDMVRLIGRENYRCLINKKFNVAEAPCIAGWNCPKIWHCDYFATKKKAAEFLTPIVTNYSYFLGETQSGNMMRNLDILILDEGHMAESALMAHVNVTLDEQELRRVGIQLPRLGTIDKYREWGVKTHQEIAQEIHKTAQFIAEYSKDPFADDLLIRRYRLLRNQQKSIIGINNFVEDNWILEHQAKRVMFRPLWVKKYGRLYLSTADKIVIQSATIVSPSKMADLMGIPPGDWTYMEVPSTFPKERRPFYYWPVVAVGMNLNTTEANKLVQSVDQIIDKHPGERGIIHTTNYMLRDLVKMRSKHANIMLTHTGQDREKVIEDFLQDKGGAKILLSPSVTSGVNASYHRCSFQIIMKVPFADRSDEQTRKRMEEDPEWYNFNAASAVVQAYGRAMRYEDDYGETYILDKHFSWFYSRNMEMFPVWFKEAVKRIDKP